MEKIKMKKDLHGIGTFSPPPIGGQGGHIMSHGHTGHTGQVVQMPDAVGQTLAGITPTNGQNISVNVSSASPHLPFGEWVKRGVLSAIGNAAMFPFRLISRLFEALLMGILNMVKIAVVIVLVPTLIWAGVMLQQHLSHASSVREGAASATVQGSEVIKGITDGTKAKQDPVKDHPTK